MLVENRGYNFSAGPAMLPTAVIQTLQAELLNYDNLRQSIMEIGHRTADFQAVVERSESLLREIMSIPDDYAVMFMHGGASHQFAMVPMNLATDSPAAYFNTGYWSKKAIQEASRFTEVVQVAGSHECADGYAIDAADSWQVPENAAYLHFTPNETISGLSFQAPPNRIQPSIKAPLVADMTSYILSEEIDVRDYGFIYAGAQKNAGISGITIGIIRRDLLERLAHTSHVVPTLFKYETYVNEQSCYNTPPTFAWYVTLRMLEWVKEQGGPKTFAMQHARQSEWLYSLIDSSDFYQSAVSEPYRSKMNIAFRLPDAKLEPIFLDLAEQNDLLALKGHRSVGGLRASLYNAMPDEGVKSLVDFMKTFEKTHG